MCPSRDKMSLNTMYKKEMQEYVQHARPHVADLQFSLKRKSRTMKTLLRRELTTELIVGTVTVSSLPFTMPTRSSLSNTAAKFF